jgi:hypothetical protein
MKHRRNRRNRREGSLLAEASMAAVIAAVAICGVVQMVFAAGDQLRKREHHALVVREVGNLMEDLFSRSWDELSASQPPKLQLSEELRSRIPDATLNVAIESEADRPGAIRITIRVASPRSSDLNGGAVHLVAWRERTEEKLP